MNDFSATATVRAAWAMFKERSGFLIFTTLVIFAFAALIGSLNGELVRSSALPVLGFFVSIALGTLLGMGMTAFFLQAHDAIESVELATLWHPQQFLNFLAVRILTSIAVGVGIVLFIVPGIMFALMFLFASFVVIDRELGPIEAMKESVRITKGYRFELLLLLLILLVLNILGTIAFLVGLLVSIPVSMLALVHAYRTLELKAKTPSVL